MATLPKKKARFMHIYVYIIYIHNIEKLAQLAKGINTKLKPFSKYYQTLQRNSKYLGTPVSPFLRAACRLAEQSEC